ncbi:MAG: ATP-binding cassette domain-containing protein [Planctomycetes bacterium]|nr:ATP-binding cassette domain-containing protein [Planctomycetota bacterium]
MKLGRRLDTPSHANNIDRLHPTPLRFFMIQVQQLVKYYGPHLAVDRLDLNVEDGQVVGILGPNGAGKTTTLRILTCFMPPTSGNAKVNGHDILTDSDAVRKSIGYLPEATPLYPEMRVCEQLHYFGRLHGLSRAARQHRIADLTDACGLNQIIHRPIGNLSKGNKQRVGLAQALLHDPPVLILDEPTAGLDPTQITEVRKLILSLAERKTILLCTHILPEVEKTCQRVVIINRGRIAAEGTPDDLKAKVRLRSRVLVEVKAEPEQVRAAFEKLNHVADVSVTSHNGWTSAAVTPKGGADIRELLGDAVIERRWSLREMRHETASLEEFFIQITSADSIAAA